MRSAITLVLAGEHSFPDPEIEALTDLEACMFLRDGSQCEADYVHWESNVSQAIVECRFWGRQCRTRLSIHDDPSALSAGPGMEWHVVDPLEYLDD